MTMIEAERERYVAHFELVLAEFRKKGAKFAQELLISINSDELPYPYRYLRADLVENSIEGQPKISEIWLAPASDAEARGFQFGPVQVEIYPFTWCAAQVIFDKKFPDMNLLESFFTKWLDVSDSNVSPDGNANAIHSVTRIESNGELHYLTVDLGTAPADVLLDLIDLLANKGMVGRIIIQSHSD